MARQSAAATDVTYLGTADDIAAPPAPPPSATTQANAAGT